MAQFQYFRSTDQGAIALTGQVGAGLNVLDAVLVNGTNATNITSVTRTGTTATVTTSAPHNVFAGMQVTIAGADQGAYNGTFTVTTVPSTTTFTYEVAGSPATPGTGTITWKKTGAGWTKPFTGTNVAAYRMGSGIQAYLRVDDNGTGAGGAREVLGRGFITMSDVNTGTDPHPTVAQRANGNVGRKSSTLDATARAYLIAADSRTVYGFAQSEGTTQWLTFVAWGEFNSIFPSDAFRCIMLMRNTENSGLSSAECLTQLVQTLTAGISNYIPRSYTGLGTSIDVNKHVDVKNNANFLGGGTSFPAPNPNGSVLIEPVGIAQVSPLVLRGYLRGIWCPTHNQSDFADGDLVQGTGALAGRSFLMVKPAGNTGMCLLEISNTLDTN